MNGKEMTDNNVNSNQPKEIDDHFEGEETLSREYKEQMGDEDENSTSEVYPDAVVSIFPESQSAFQLFRKYQKTPPLIKLDPDYQRESIWTIKQKSELIESILMGIPLPVIYVKEDEQGTYIIVDGRQRLTTLFDFMTHKYKLKGLKVLSDLNGYYFSDNEQTNKEYLSQLQQSKIEDCQLSLNVIKPPTPDRVTFDLFDRVNRGGTRLNNQEMRNALYQGEATSFLKELAGLDSFKKATEHAVATKRMKDRYLILRLVAFYLWRKGMLIDVKSVDQEHIDYRSDMEDFLSKTMLYLNSPISRQFRKKFLFIFDKAMTNCFSIWGDGCFRLPSHPDNPRKKPINMALFESAGYLMIGLLEMPKSSALNFTKFFLDILDGVFDFIDGSYITSLTYNVDSKVNVELRFEIIEHAINEVKEW